MRRAKLYLSVFVLLLLNLYSCSRGGVPDGEESTTPAAKVPTGDDAIPDDQPAIEPPVTTSTILQIIDSKVPAGKLCFKKEPFKVLATIETDITPNGDLQDWKEVEFTLQDPKGDFDGFDVHEAAVSLVKTSQSSHFAIAMRGDSFSSWTAGDYEVKIQFGAMIKNESESGAIEYNTLRQFVLKPTGLEKFSDGQYLPMSTEEYEFAVSPSGFLELKIRKSELDEVLLQPLWSFESQISKKGSSLEEVIARTFFQNILSYPTGFRTDLCHVRMGSNTVTFQQITDESLLAEVSSGENARADYGPEELEKKIETRLSMIRHGFDTSWMLMGKPKLQVANFPIILNKAEELIEIDPEIPINPAGHLIFNISNAENRNPFYLKGIYEKSVNYIIGKRLSIDLPTASQYVRGVVGQVISQHIIKGQLGTKYWLETFQRKIQTFTQNEKPTEPVGLKSWQEMLDAGELSGEAKSLFASKIRAYSLAIYNRININQLLSVIRDFKDEYSAQAKSFDLQQVYAAVEEKMGVPVAEDLFVFDAGWITSGPYLNDHSPFLLSDEDLDGLPRFFELSLATNPGREDTDKDGWTDLSEVYAMSDPKSASSKPTGIMADGSFGDWQEMLPDLIQSDRGTNSEGCPEAADISHYAALYDGNRIIFAAAGKDLWAEPPYVRWEVQVAINTAFEKKIFTLRTVKNRYYYDVLEGPERKLILRYPSAKPLGIDSMEWTLDLGILGYSKDDISFNRFDVKYRISTLFEDKEKILCDDTSWAKPLFSKLDN